MDIDFAQLSAYQRYKLMASLIVPRPIALVTTLSETGVVNAAPFSMFNMVGEDPPLVMLSVNLHNASRHVFFGRVQWLHARDGLVDPSTWRVRLQDYFPVARFGASYYVRTRDRFAIPDAGVAPAPNPIDEL